MICIGIDPGISGAIGVVGLGSDLPSALDCPIITGKKHDYDLRAMRDLISNWAQWDQVIVVVERVHAMPKQGVTSSFSFGRGFGIWQGILVALGIPYHLVEPATWKRHYGLLGKDKSASRVLASRLFPSCSFARKKDDGRAEALLLADYGRTHFGTQCENKIA